MSSYESLGAEIGRLVQEKQAAYGDSFGKSGQVLRLLYPDGIRPEQYDDMLAIVRDLDKTFRIATRKDAFGEDPWKDKAGYALLAAARNASATTPEPKPAEPPAFDWTTVKIVKGLYGPACVDRCVMCGKEIGPDLQKDGWVWTCSGVCYADNEAEADRRYWALHDRKVP